MMLSEINLQEGAPPQQTEKILHVEGGPLPDFL